MRIAVWHNLPSGGGKRALYDHVRGLLARGHTVEAWCPPTADRTFLPLAGLIREHVLDLALPSTRRLSDRLGVTRSMKRSIAAMEAHCRACARQITSNKFDILFANSCQFFRTTSIGRFAEIPSVLYLQEPFRWLYEAMPRLRWLAQPRNAGLKASIQDFRNIRNWRLQAREEVDNAAAFDSILVNSFFSRESVLRAYGLDASVCYLGVDADHFAASGQARERIVVGLGSLTAEKNIGFCIEAVALLALPRPKLCWVGNIANGDYFDQMRVLAKSRDVEFDPMVGVGDAEVLNILSRASVMVYAPRLEPFGLAPLEANACGLPVVAVAEGGVRETIVDGVNGLLVDHKPEAMSAAIETLLADPLRAARLGADGRQMVLENWNLEAATSRLEGALQRHASLGGHGERT